LGKLEQKRGENILDQIYVDSRSSHDIFLIQRHHLKF
jgi:hypothetical protein